MMVFAGLDILVFHVSFAHVGAHIERSIPVIQAYSSIAPLVHPKGM